MRLFLTLSHSFSLRYNDGWFPFFYFSLDFPLFSWHFNCFSMWFLFYLLHNKMLMPTTGWADNFFFSSTSHIFRIAWQIGDRRRMIHWYLAWWNCSYLTKMKRIIFKMFHKKLPFFHVCSFAKNKIINNSILFRICWWMCAWP